MKKTAQMAVRAFVWLTILAGGFAFLAVVGLFDALWRLFRWLANI